MVLRALLALSVFGLTVRPAYAIEGAHVSAGELSSLIVGRTVRWGNAKSMTFGSDGNYTVRTKSNVWLGQYTVSEDGFCTNPIWTHPGNARVMFGYGGACYRVVRANGGLYTVGPKGDAARFTIE